MISDEVTKHLSKTALQSIIDGIGMAKWEEYLNNQVAKKNITESMIKDLYKARGYISKNKNMKEVKDKEEDKPKGLMSRSKEDK